MQETSSTEPILFDILKNLFAVSLAFSAGFLAFLATVKSPPSTEWAIYICLLGLTLCALSSLFGTFWGAMIILKQNDLLSNRLFFYSVVVALASFAIGIVTGVVTVLSWL